MSSATTNHHPAGSPTDPGRSPAPADPEPADPELAGEVVTLVRRWLDESAEAPADPAGARLAAMLSDPAGLSFTVAFIDGVVRPEDPAIAARNLSRLAHDVPGFLPRHLRLALRLGAGVSRVVPHLVIPVVRRAVRAMVGHLIIDASERRLGGSIARLRGRGVRLNINLLGETVLGDAEATRRLERTHQLLARPDVDYVSVKVSSVVAPHPGWAFEESVAHIVDRLRPLYLAAAATSPHTFINLDMEEYEDLALTVAVFTTMLDQPELADLQAGIVLQAYLPEALPAMEHLQEWAARRRAAGGAPVKVRLVKGANLPMERVSASLHGWPLATWSTKAESDAHYKRVLDYALHPERVRNVRLGVAGHNLFDLAFAWLLAGRRGVRDAMDVEMLLGMAQEQASAVRADVGDLLLYTPVVHPREFDVAIAYLVRRLEEGAAEENFMSAVFELRDDATLFERERSRFLTSLAAVGSEVVASHRDQDRHQPPADHTGEPFANAPDTDFALEANRRWGREILARATTSQLGLAGVAEHTVTDPDRLEQLIAATQGHGRSWGARPAAERAAVLDRVALELERRRADLIEVMAAEAGKTLDQSDPEVSEAVDFARYYAEAARDLDHVDGARFVPQPLTVVAPPWNFPVAIPAGSVLAALAAGSAVIIKPSPQAQRCGTVLAEALWAAGVPREVLQLVHLEESDLGRRLVADPRVDRLILTGAFETATLFRSFRPDLPLLAETSGKNAVVVTPSADLDLAARDVAASAFGHAGQKCSAASLVILVGSVARSPRFRRQLVDAVTSMKVGVPTDPTTQIGPIIEPATGKLHRALTQLAPGESWLVAPRRLDDEGRLWSPGVRDRVARGSQFHLTEYFGPVLGVMHADTLEEAIAIQNQVDYGLTAGLHSLDRTEIATWLDRVEAGNLYVNRGTTGAIVRRQPFGGWKKSAVGTGTKAGGPTYLFALGDWRSAPAHADSTGTASTGLDRQAQRLLDAAAGLLEPAEQDFLSRSLHSDARAWSTAYGVTADVSALTAERNVLRYCPAPVTVRHTAGGTLAELLRVLAAGRRSGAPVTVSTHEALPAPVTALVHSCGWPLAVETDAAFAAARRDGGEERVRLVGGDGAELARATGGRPDLAVHAHPVTESGRVELLPFLREQAISITAHRFGTPDHLTDGLL